MNLPNNCKANILRLLCFKLGAFGNGDDDDEQKLPEECLELEVFSKVLIALVSINKLLILLGKDKDKPRKTFDNTVVHTPRRKMHLSHPCVWQQYHAR